MFVCKLSCLVNLILGTRTSVCYLLRKNVFYYSLLQSNVFVVLFCQPHVGNPGAPPGAPHDLLYACHFVMYMTKALIDVAFITR